MMILTEMTEGDSCVFVLISAINTFKFTCCLITNGCCLITNGCCLIQLRHSDIDVVINKRVLQYLYFLQKDQSMK